jgi:hypothetical protein
MQTATRYHVGVGVCGCVGVVCVCVWVYVCVRVLWCENAIDVELSVILYKFAWCTLFCTNQAAN